MDNNLEMLTRAKTYLEQLANGVDPLSGASLPDDTVLNNVRISRCFFFVADVLQLVIENGGEVKRAVRQSLSPFTISEEEKARIELSDEPLMISKLCDRINSQIDTEKFNKLKVTAFGKWLVDKGFLNIEIHNDNKYKKATTAGIKIGIVSEWRTYGDHDYYAVTYKREAQQFLLDNLDEIIAVSNGGSLV